MVSFFVSLGRQLVAIRVNHPTSDSARNGGLSAPGSWGRQVRRACHAESRGFESHHPLQSGDGPAWRALMAPSWASWRCLIGAVPCLRGGGNVARVLFPPSNDVPVTADRHTAQKRVHRGFRHRRRPRYRAICRDLRVSTSSLVMKGSAVRIRASAFLSRKSLHNAESCCLSRRRMHFTRNDVLVRSVIPGQRADHAVRNGNRLC